MCLGGRSVATLCGDVHAPAGTVAFLMTDIEGSTRLLSSAGDAFPRILDEHFALPDRAVDSEGGTPVSNEGDALLPVFPSARQAIAAALAAQRLLGKHSLAGGRDGQGPHGNPRRRGRLRRT